MEAKPGLEEQLFSWDGWDQIDTADFQFNDVVLKQRIGQFDAGTSFRWAAVYFSRSELHLGNADEDGYWIFPLKLAPITDTGVKKETLGSE